METLKGFPLRGSCRAYARLMRCSHAVALNEIDEVKVTDATHPTPHPLHFVQHLLLKEKALQTFPLTGEFPLGKGANPSQKSSNILNQIIQILIIVIHIFESCKVIATLLL